MTTYPDPILKPGPLAHFEHGYNRVAVSADGRFVATSDVDMNIVVRQGEDVVFDGNFGSDNDKIRPTERVRGLAFSPTGATLYIAAGSEVAALRTATWMPAWHYEPPRSLGLLIVSPIALDVSANGDVAAAFDNGSIVVWDSAGIKKQTIRDNDSPRWMRFVADGSELVGSDSFSLCKWHPAQRKKMVKIVPQSRIFSIDADRTGQFAAVRTLQDVAIWELRERELIASIPVAPGVPVVAFYPSSELVAYAEKGRI